MAEIFAHPIPAVLIMLGVLVFVHELGHYLVGRWCGIAVEMFSIGFGPKVAAFTRNGTEFRIGWIPLGGFVKFAGSHPAEDIPPDLPGKPMRDVSVGKRVATVAAGPIANMLLAFVLYTIMGMAGIEHPPAEIGEVLTDSAAEQAGFRYGDEIVSIAGEPVQYWRDLNRLISKSPGKKLTVEVRRDGEIVTLSLTPAEVEGEDLAGRKVKIGRAGVALARLPAIIAVQEEQSEAAKAGLQTGDEILAVISADGQEEQTKSYPHFIEQLQKRGAAAMNAVTLRVQRAGLPGAEQKLAPGEERRVELSLMPLMLSSQSTPHPRILGIGPAELVVGIVSNPAVGSVQFGDRLLQWQGVPIRDRYHLYKFLEENKEPKVKILVQRKFERVEVEVNLKPIDVQKAEGRVTAYMLPVTFWAQPENPDPVIERYANPIAAVGYGVKQTFVRSGELLYGLGLLITGNIPLKALGGPLLIAKVASDSAKRGWQSYLGTMALISINLFLINLFPIPVLDGGQLILLGVEAVRRRPLREAAIENFQKVGFVMVLSLIVLAMYNDLSRFWKSMLETLVGAFP